jgi:hypothetical protein
MGLKARHCATAPMCLGGAGGHLPPRPFPVPFFVGGNDAALRPAASKKTWPWQYPFSLPLTSLCLDHQLSLWINRSFTTGWHDEDRMCWQRVNMEFVFGLLVLCDAPTGAPRPRTDEEKNWD